MNFQSVGTTERLSTQETTLTSFSGLRLAKVEHLQKRKHMSPKSAKKKVNCFIEEVVLHQPEKTAIVFEELCKSRDLFAAAVITFCFGSSRKHLQNPPPSDAREAGQSGECRGAPTWPNGGHRHQTQPEAGQSERTQRHRVAKQHDAQTLQSGRLHGLARRWRDAASGEPDRGREPVQRFGQDLLPGIAA